MVNDPLDALRPLHEPAAISWWPPAPGWWVLLLFLLFVLLVFWRWKRATLQRAALRELKLLASKINTSQQAAAINQLLKRYALVCWPAAEVAALTGESWLKFLDRHGGNGAFSQGPGRVLLTLPYYDVNQHNEELISLAYRWIKTNSPCSN